MQTLVQIASLFAFALFAMLAGFMIETAPVLAVYALIIAALCALMAVVSVLQESAEERAWNEFKARQWRARQ